MAKCQTCGFTDCNCSYQQRPIWRHRLCKYCHSEHFDNTCTAQAMKFRPNRILQVEEGRHVLFIEEDGDVKMTEWTECQLCLKHFKN
jgi:hypothetical protein